MTIKSQRKSELEVESDGENDDATITENQQQQLRYRERFDDFLTQVAIDLKVEISKWQRHHLGYRLIQPEIDDLKYFVSLID